MTSPPEGGRSSTHRARARATWQGRPQALHTLEGGWLGQKCHMYTVPETRVGRRSLCPSQARQARHTRTRKTKQARTKAGARTRTRHSEAHTHARGSGAGAAGGALCMPLMCTHLPRGKTGGNTDENTCERERARVKTTREHLDWGIPQRCVVRWRCVTISPGTRTRRVNGY